MAKLTETASNAIETQEKAQLGMIEDISSRMKVLNRIEKQMNQQDAEIIRMTADMQDPDVDREELFHRLQEWGVGMNDMPVKLSEIEELEEELRMLSDESNLGGDALAQLDGVERTMKGMSKSAEFAEIMAISENLASSGSSNSQITQKKDGMNVDQSRKTTSNAASKLASEIKSKPKKGL